MTLPQPNGPFEWTQEKWGRALRCAAMPAPHLFSTTDLRLGGSGWADLARSLGLAPSNVLHPRQAHGADAVVVSHRDSDPAAVGAAAADIIMTGTSTFGVAVRSADCVPLLLADARTGAVAAAHAGWRGTAAGVARAAVQQLERHFGSRPEDLIVAVGPSIGPCCYRVGEELLPAFGEAGRCWFSRLHGGLMLNLWKANEDQLVQAGVKRGNVHVAELCTAMHGEVFPSYRRDGRRAGRLVAVIKAAGQSRCSS